MVLMKQLLLVFTITGAIAGAADLAGVRSVYMLPMGKSLDQYLANRLTNEHVFQVVTDPAKADAIFTDRLGEGFEGKLSEILPAPEAPPAPAPKEDEKKSADKKAADAKTNARGDVGPGSETVNKLSKPGGMSSIARSRGTVFLVDAKTREVLWSAYMPPRDSSSRQMDKTASALVVRMKHDLGK
jgi:hypothetical protein